MTQNKDLAVQGLVGGKFTDVTDTLLPLFCDPDGRGTRRWREVFGLETSLPPDRGGPYVSVRVGRQSSSDC